MRWPRRTRREVYRVFDEQDFLGDGAVDAPQLADLRPVAEAPRERSSAGRRRMRDRVSTAERRSLRPLAPALLLMAVIAAGAIAVDAVSTLMRGRPRSTEGSRPASSPAVPAPGRARPSPDRSHRARVRPRVRRHRLQGRSGRRHRPLRLPRSSAVRMVATPTKLESPRAEPNRGEFSFERQAHP
jgi:hypothetical protein